MANLHQWQPGMKSIILNDFETNEHINISLDPEKNAIQNAQALYKQHQKLKRAKSAVEPLLEEVIKEINYLTQVETAVTQLDCDSTPEDLQTLLEIKEELIAEKYFEDSQYAKSPQKQESQPYRYLSPSGFEVLIGRNNRQNDRLTFRTATDYDLWFHSQEIPGSHVLLRLKPGAIPDREDLNFTANLAAYYSQGRESQQIPIVYTKPKSVYKPKGAKPGMAIYKKETIIWGYPQEAKVYLSQQGQP
jgi:predicted ribosome quality control (RQC) complex YloA/Tae2 family protein